MSPLRSLHTGHSLLLHMLLTSRAAYLASSSDSSGKPSGTTGMMVCSLWVPGMGAGNNARVVRIWVKGAVIELPLTPRSLNLLERLVNASKGESRGRRGEGCRSVEHVWVDARICSVDGSRCKVVRALVDTSAALIVPRRIAEELGLRPHRVDRV